MYKQGVKVLPWAVNLSITFNKLREMGVDGVITDYPHLIYNK
jgi:glycerophosphoryl diester phosphodiesterase